MKKLFLGLMAASLLMTACTQSTKPTQTAATTTAIAAKLPVMKFEFDTHDFGKLKQGDKVTYEFKFTNTGKLPLIISSASATCGCTTPEWPKTPVQPGEGGKISVTFNSTGKTGLQDKIITVNANTNPAQTMVHLIGEVTTK